MEERRNTLEVIIVNSWEEVKQKKTGGRGEGVERREFSPGNQRGSEVSLNLGTNWTSVSSSVTEITFPALSCFLGSDRCSPAVCSDQKLAYSVLLRPWIVGTWTFVFFLYIIK